MKKVLLFGAPLLLVLVLARLIQSVQTSQLSWTRLRVWTRRISMWSKRLMILVKALQTNKVHLIGSVKPPWPTPELD